MTTAPAAGPILLLLGAPGAGKGTQAKLLAASTGALHVAAGDLFRAEIAAGTALGRAADAAISEGRLVSDDVTIAMIARRLEQPDARGAVLLDGFPRTAAQAIAFEAGIGRPTAALLLQVDPAVLTDRLTGRLTCPGCGRSFHAVNLPPAVPGRCDGCGNTLVTRSDDNPVTVEKRLRNQLGALAEVVGVYGAARRLVVVNGERPIADTARAVATAALAAGIGPR